MNIKSNKGFTGADVTVAVLIVTVFAGVIAALYQNYSLTSKQIERKAQAVDYAVQTIEEIKENSAKYFDATNGPKEQITVYDELIENTGLKKVATLKDYSMENAEAQTGYVKLVNVKIDYKVGNKEQSVELNTIISKEN